MLKYNLSILCSVLAHRLSLLALPFSCLAFDRLRGAIRHKQFDFSLDKPVSHFVCNFSLCGANNRWVFAQVTYEWNMLL